jgi:hypothetical protein
VAAQSQPTPVPREIAIAYVGGQMAEIQGGSPLFDHFYLLR